MDTIAPPPKPTPPPAAPNPSTPSKPTPPLKPASSRHWLQRHWKWLTLVIGLIVIGSSIYAWTLLRPTPTPTAIIVNHATPKPTPTPTPLQKASPLTGAMIDPALADRPIVSVIVENSPEARPQSGLGQAGVVYEALAEGGITRFQTFFLDGQPSSLGPVRSLRPYFVDWGLEFNAPVAHAGGSATALDMVGPTGMKDLNALIIGAPSFYRTSDRQAPHNLYTSSGLLDKLLAKHAWDQPASFTPSPRQADHAVNPAPHPNIHISYSYSLFDVDYTYDASHNDYLRSLAGKPHVDRLTNTQIRVKNVVVEYMPTETLADDKGHVQMGDIGSGQCLVFRDGDATPCTWKKTSRTTRTQLLGADGKDIPLNVGNTWYSVVPTNKPVRY